MTKGIEVYTQNRRNRCLQTVHNAHKTFVFHVNPSTCFLQNYKFHGGGESFISETSRRREGYVRRLHIFRSARSFCRDARGSAASARCARRATALPRICLKECIKTDRALTRERLFRGTADKRREGVCPPFFACAGDTAGDTPYTRKKP